MPIARAPTPSVGIDWNGDGDYGDAYEDVTSRVLGSPGVAIQRGRDQSRGTGTSMVPAGSWDLDNHDRVLSPSTGPLIGQVVPGRACYVAEQFGDATTTMGSSTATMADDLELMGGYVTSVLFTGKVDEISQSPGFGAQKVSIRALGTGLLKLRGVLVSTALASNITTGGAMALLLAGAGLDPTQYVIDADVLANGRLLSYWYADAVDAYSAAVQLLVTEGYPAALYEDALGRVVFEGRNYRTLQARSTTVQATLRDVAAPAVSETSMASAGILMADAAVGMDGSGSLSYVDLTYDPGFKDVVNDVSVDVTTRVLGGGTVVWSYGQTLSLGVGASTRIIARPSDPFTSAVVPSTGGGDIVVSAGAVTATLSRTSGGSTAIYLTAGGAGAVITTLQLSAQPLQTRSNVRLTHTIDTSASVAMYGTRSQSPSVWPGLAPAEATSLADALVRAYQQPRPVFGVTVVNLDGRHLARQILTEVSDRLQLVNAHLGEDVPVMVERIDHRLGPAGLLTTVLACEQVVEQGYAVWDDINSTWGPDVHQGIWGA